MNLLILQPSDICNFKCEYCSSAKYVRKTLDTSHLVPYDVLVNWIKRYINPEEWIVEITGGGEPSLYPRFCDLIQELSGLGYTGMIRTNGSMPIPKTGNFQIITAWHSKYSVNELPLYYDKLLILENPADEWENKVKYCVDKGIPYFVGALKNHRLPPHKRVMHFGNNANKATNAIFKRTWVIYADGNMRCCNRRIPKDNHRNIKDGNAPDLIACCAKCPFVFDVETHLTPGMREHCKRYYDKQLLKSRGVIK